jgi:uncharacterized protein YfaS (alpha-2-macroglobulin family)
MILSFAAPVHGIRGESPPSKGTKKAAVTGEATMVSWKEVDRLIGEDKFEEAAKVTEKLLAKAKKTGDEADWTRSLIKLVQLRTGLHGYETSVRFLAEQEWPQGALYKSALQLFYARSIVTYTQAYSWEISQREKVEAKGPVDLKAWTKEDLLAEARRAYLDVWKQREALGAMPVEKLAEYLDPNDYPKEVRGTLRDAVSYLFVELLGDTSYWSPEQSNDLFRLGFRALLAGGAAEASAPVIENPKAHPLVQLCAVLDDLEGWHAGRGDRAASLEARLERLRRLRNSFTEKADRAAILAELERRLPAFRDLSWWAVGQDLLATWVSDTGAPDRQVRARALALEGWKAYPDSVGGRRCNYRVKAIEGPEYQLLAMSLDGPGKRSVQITHRNLDRLYFRAYVVDLEGRIATSKDYNLLPQYSEVRALLDGERPAAEWSVDLPDTPDYLDHVTFVVPPMKVPGFYVLAASARKDFSHSGNKILCVNTIVSDLVLVVRQESGESAEVQALSGRTGQGVAGATVALYQFDYQKGHRKVDTVKTDAEGFARIQRGEGYNYFLLARKGDELSLDECRMGFYKTAPPSEYSASMVYTDRSIYRPGQKLYWKVVAYQSADERKRFEVLPGGTVTVDLLDPNGEKVETATVTMNLFGSAAGEFTVPSGRLLGAWRLRTSPNGGANVRVEEYKRPTFEASFKDPESPLRLNRPAELKGEVKYYFGLPVVNGSVKWRVVREPVFPWWWGWYGYGRGNTQTVATGTASLDESGNFTVAFTPEVDEREKPNRDVTYSYTVTADVTDEGGETRTATRAVRLGFVSIEASVGMEAGFFLDNVPGAMTVTRSDLNGTPKAGKGKWTLASLKQPPEALLPADQPVPSPPGGKETEGYKTEGDRLRPRWDTSVSPEAILFRWEDGVEKGRGALDHDAKGQAKVVLPSMPPGAYRLRYETVDDFGEVCKTQKEFVVAGKRTPLALPALLMQEKTSVEAGGTARFLVLSGLSSQPMLFEIFKDGKLFNRQKLDASKDANLVEVPVLESDRGGFGVRLTLLRDHQFMSSQRAIFVPWDDKELKVEFATFRDKIRPGGKETWRVTVKRSDGKVPEGAARLTPEAGTAELLAYMYDRSLDIFAPHHPPSPLSLYPGRSGVPNLRDNLAMAYPSYSDANGWGILPNYPSLIGDRLKFYDGYGIGGPGRRNGRMYKLARRMEGGVAEEAMPMAMPPPAPAMAASGVAGGIESPGKADALEDAKEKKEADKSANVVAPEPQAPQVEVRSNFAETAFWQPQMISGPDGSASIEFQVPDSVTSWNVWVHALTKDLRGGSLHKETKSVKDLMVRPYVPRFLREGDKAELKVVVNNASDAEMTGILTFEIFDPETQKSMLKDFGFDSDSPVHASFAVKAGGGENLSFPLVTPKDPGLVAFKVTAVSGDLSDGELRVLPVLPGRMHLAQSRFVTLKEGSKRTMTFEDLARNDDPSLVNDFMVVTVDAQLFYQVLEALPYLVRYPYECTEQTLNRFLSTGIVSSLYADYPAVATMAKEFSKRDSRLETFDAADPNRKMALEETPWLNEARGSDGPSQDLINVLDPRVAKAERDSALVKLKKSQTSLGGFPWWPGGPPSPYMTLYLVHGFSKGLEFGVDVPKDVVVKAFAYLHRHYLDECVKTMMAHDTGWEFVTFLNYTISNFPDSSWTGGVFTDAERSKMLNFSFKHWKQHAPFLKGLLALTLKRSERMKDAKLVFDSVMDSSKTTQDEGTFWAAEDRSWLWYNDTIETHAFALRTLMELEPKDPRSEGLVQWVLLNKKLNHWKSTRATAEVIYSLVWYLKQTGGLGVRESAKVQLCNQETTFIFEPDKYTGKKNQIVVHGPKVDPLTCSTITVEKEGKGFAFASATWHFSTEKLPEAERGDFFQVTRKYFLRESTPSGFVLKPLAAGTPLKVGDQLEIQLSLRSKHAAEYVHLRDPRAAGLEPENAVSRYKWDLGIGWYEEVRDSGANFFFEALPVGEYTFKYRLRANMAGTFKVGPATVQSMYAPEFNAYSAGNTLEIRGE